MTPKAITQDCQSIIETLINGNLKDAKDRAKKHSSWKLMTIAEEMGYSIEEYVAIAGYLKNAIDFQKYCDIMNK